MNTVQDIYESLESHIKFEEFKEQVEQKYDVMNGFVDKDAAAVLISNGLTIRPAGCTGVSLV